MRIKELELFPDYLSGSNQAGWLFYKHEKYDDAFVAFKNSIRIDPAHHYAYRLLGDLYFYKTRQLEQALEMYLKAQVLDASEVKLDLLIADVMYDLKRSDAHKYLVRYLERVDISDLKNQKNIEVAQVLKKDITTAKWFVELKSSFGLK